jgi:transposase
MPKPYPREFREDVVAVARKGQATLTQIAKDFGISESCLSNWLRAANVEDGKRPGVTVAESEQLRELKKRNRLLEQENEVLRRARRTCRGRVCRGNDVTRSSVSLPATGSPSR